MQRAGNPGRTRARAENGFFPMLSLDLQRIFPLTDIMILTQHDRLFVLSGAGVSAERAMLPSGVRADCGTAIE